MTMHFIPNQATKAEQPSAEQVPPANQHLFEHPPQDKGTGTTTDSTAISSEGGDADARLLDTNSGITDTDSQPGILSHEKPAETADPWFGKEDDIDAPINPATPEERRGLIARLSPMQRGFAIGAGAVTLLGAVFGVGHNKGTTSAERTSADIPKATDDVFEEPVPTTTTIYDNLSEAIDNVGGQQEQTPEFAPVYVQGDSLPTKENPGVINLLFTNYAKAYQEKDSRYLNHYFFDTEDPYAQHVIGEVETLPSRQNHLVVETTVLDSIEIDNKTWVVRVSIRHRGVGIDSDPPQIRDITLKKKGSFENGELRTEWLGYFEKIVTDADPIRDWSEVSNF